jgi:hypothetical protein
MKPTTTAKVALRISTTRSVRRILRRLTLSLSGLPPPVLRLGERAIHCEHEAPTLVHVRSNE